MSQTFYSEDWESTSKERKKKLNRRNDDNNVYGYGDVAHGTTWLSSSWSGMRHKRDIMDESKSGLGFSFRGISPY